MKTRKILALALAVIMAAALAACGGGGGTDTPSPSPGTSPNAENSPTPTGGTLTICSWEGMFPDEVIARFEQETGIRVNYVPLPDGETMLSKLRAADGGDYDLVIFDDYILAEAIGDGLAQKLDKSKIPNFGNIDPTYQGYYYDTTDEYTVPYGAGVQTLAYDPALTGFEITSYADLWDARLAGSLGVISNFRVINGMALKVLGMSYNTENPDDITAAGAKLLELAPNIRRINDDNMQDDLVSGEISAAVMYTSQVTLAKLANPDIKIVFPPEGIGFGIMAGFIPVNAPNADAAHQFLDFILDGETGAECFEWLCYYSTNSAANEFLSEEMRDLLTLPEGFNEDMEMIEPISADTKAQHELIWSQFRAATGQLTINN